MSFKDIFKSKFLENVTSISILDMALAMVLSFFVGLFIFWIYKLTYRGVMYSSSFGVTLIGLTMISTLVILAVTSNVVLSLGMVGALSIVRFRSAIKEPLDIAFLFWSIAVGIVIAAGMLPLAVLGSLLIGLILVIFVSWKSHDNPFILVLRCESEDAEVAAQTVLEANIRKLVLKSKSVRNGEIELHYEVRLKDSETSFLSSVADTEGVQDVVLVSYKGDYVG
ncbi:MAG: DUF4956 domain-containing protein [Clostridiaceae bacterium]|jgi:uncharacterized membrane protein YhiD involved in acid resistance|nr:DUF4956 domain-containing protein [Clostridia bacterium]MBP6161836.1 DUF4956 domain-containing protein [Clostridia bacterium]NMA36363.1 DUF4956 domain-containing protein [Clostridiaceae bacterium]